MKEVRFLKGLEKGLFFMKRELRKPSESITRLATLAMLSALGFVLMAFAKFPNPFAPWLKIEISETVVILAYALYGLPGGMVVVVVKTLLNMLISGLSANGLGDLTAFITSCMFLLGLFITSRLRLFKRGIGYRVVAYTIIALIVTVVMTLLNAIFITPTYLTYYSPNFHFQSCFDEGVIKSVTNYLLHTEYGDGQVSGWLYVGAISLIYAPFNLLKAAICCIAYELLFNRLVFIFMKRSEFFQKWFVGNIFTKKVEEEPANDSPEIKE